MSTTISQPTRDQLLPFQGVHEVDGLCHIRVYAQPGRLPVVIAGELRDNPGTTVCDGIEMVARAVQQEFFRDGREFELVQYNPARYEECVPEFLLVRFSHSDASESLLDPAARAGRVILGDDAGKQVTLGHTIDGDFRDPRWMPIRDIAALTGCPVEMWLERDYTARAVGGVGGEYLRRQVAARAHEVAQRLIALLAVR